MTSMIRDFKTRHDEFKGTAWVHIRSCQELFDDIFKKHKLSLSCPEKIGTILYNTWMREVNPLGKEIIQTRKEFLKAYKEFIDLQELDGEEIRIRITSGKTNKRKPHFKKEGYIAKAMIYELAVLAERDLARWENPRNVIKKGRPSSFREPALELYEFLIPQLKGDAKEKARQALDILVDVFDLMGFELLITKTPDSKRRKKDAIRKLISRAKKG